MSRPLLKLKAEDDADLQVLSAALQDALFRIGDAAFDARARRFTLLVDRFRWEDADGEGPYERIRALVAIEGVLQVRRRRVNLDAPEAHAWILSVLFEPAAEPPGGQIRIVLAGDGEIRLDVECVEALLSEVGEPWRTPRRPDHTSTSTEQP